MIYEAMKKDRMAAMRAKDKFTKDVLTTFLGDVESDIKRGVEADDAYVVGKLKKAAQTARANMQYAVDPNVFENELKIIESYLPSMADESQILEAIAIFEATNENRDINMGSLMKHLKEKFGANFDGKFASSIVKKHLDTK